MLKAELRLWPILGLITTQLSLATARRLDHYPTHQDTIYAKILSHDLRTRSEAKRMTAAVVGAIAAVGVFIIVLLGIAIYFWRKRQVRLTDPEAGMTASSSSPRAQIHRNQRRRKRSSKMRKRREKNGMTRIRTLGSDTTVHNRRPS